MDIECILILTCSYCMGKVVVVVVVVDATVNDDDDDDDDDDDAVTVVIVVLAILVIAGKMRTCFTVFFCPPVHGCGWRGGLGGERRVRAEGKSGG